MSHDDSYEKDDTSDDRGSDMFISDSGDEANSSQERSNYAQYNNA